MKAIFFAVVLGIALVGSGCDDAEAAKPVPPLPESGRAVMAVDGKEPGKLEKQPNGTYLLRYANGKADRVSVNEIVLMPE